MEEEAYKVDLKLKESFKPDEFINLKKFFKSHDTDKNGTIEQKELLGMLHDLGYRNFTEEDAQKLFEGIDRNSDSHISFVEYMTAMKAFQAKNKKELYVEEFVNKQGKNVKRFSKSAESFDFESYSQEEKTAYCKVINAALEDDEELKGKIPIDPEDQTELFDRLRDGIILCKIINKAQEGTIDERVINKKENMTIFHMLQNLNLALSAAKSIGVRVVGINSQLFMDDGNMSMKLGLLWQIVKQVVLCKITLKNYPELVRLLKDGEKLEDLLKLSPEQLLLRWFNYHLKNANYPKEIKNFDVDIKDSEKYTILLNQLDKNKCDKSALDEEDLTKRAEKVIANSQKLGAETYITPADICKGNTKLNTIFTAAIFNAFPGLDPPTEQEKLDAAKLLDDDVEGAREERAFRMWINSLNLEGENGEPIYVNNLYQESKNGLLLLKAIDRIKPGVIDWKKVDKKCKNTFTENTNCGEAVNASKKAKLSIVGIGGKDIHDGNKKAVLAIVWQLMRAHSLQIIGDKTEDELMKWANERVSPEYQVANLKDKKLSTGLFWIDLLKSIEERIIDWDIVIKDNDSDESKMMNAKYALSVARKLGGTVFLVWEDIVEVKAKLLLTFLASIYNIAQNYHP